MISSVVLTFLLFILATSIHLVGVSRACSHAYAIKNRLLASLSILSALFILHCLSAGILGVGFWAGEQIGLGSFRDEPSMEAMDYFCFSLINITTLGLGDIYPVGHLRFMAGIESLAGFLLISISASYIFRFITKSVFLFSSTVLTFAQFST